MDKTIGATFQLTKKISWIADKTIQNTLTGSLYASENCFVNSMDVAGTITQLKNDQNIQHTQQGSINLTCGNLDIFLGNCSVTQRFDLGSDVHMLVTDYKLTNNSNTNYIQI